MLVGILLVGLSLRMAVTAVPPLIEQIRADVPLTPVVIGLMGMLPTATFAVFGFMTPYVVRWASLDRLVVLALATSAVGQVGRAFVTDTTAFLLLTVVALAGLGAGNVLLPPLVKKYFPDKIGLLTALYVTAVSIGTAVPPQFAVPLAQASGWRPSIGIWAGISMVAAVPWLLTALGRRRSVGGSATLAPHESGIAGTGATPESGIVPPVPRRTAETPLRLNLWRSPLALGLTLMFGCTSLNTYAMFAWLPQMLREAGLDAADAGSMLALFAILGLPLSLTVPLLAARLRNPLPVVAVLLSCFVIGYLGLLLWPATATWVWVMFTGIGPGTFPLALVLTNLRTRTQQGAGALSGFSQGIGYAIACLGPLLFGLLHGIQDDWFLSFGFLGCSLVALGAGAYFACRPVMLEDHPGVVRP